MPAIRTGISATTPQNYLIGPGAVYKDFTDLQSLGTTAKLLGATAGGNQVTVTPEWFDPRPDGAPGPIKGMRRLIGVTVTAKANLLEMTKENLMLALGKATSEAYPATTPTHDKIRPALGALASTDYFNIAIVGDIAGDTDPVVFVLENACVTDAVEVNMGTGKEDVVLAVTFTAHYDPANLEQVPAYILRPQTA